jgi:hypothetical protein
MSERPSFWASIKEALGGTQQDFTEGNLSRGIALLAIPMVLEMTSSGRRLLRLPPR